MPYAGSNQTHCLFSANGVGASTCGGAWVGHLWRMPHCLCLPAPVLCPCLCLSALVHKLVLCAPVPVPVHTVRTVMCWLPAVPKRYLPVSVLLPVPQ
jgi:hypothetical protein